jgi:hypothetical protein
VLRTVFDKCSTALLCYVSKVSKVRAATQQVDGNDRDSALVRSYLQCVTIETPAERGDINQYRPQACAEGCRDQIGAAIGRQQYAVTPQAGLIAAVLQNSHQSVRTRLKQGVAPAG